MNKWKDKYGIKLLPLRLYWGTAMCVVRTRCVRSIWSFRIHTFLLALKYTIKRERKKEQFQTKKITSRASKERQWRRRQQRKKSDKKNPAKFRIETSRIFQWLLYTPASFPHQSKTTTVKNNNQRTETTTNIKKPQQQQQQQAGNKSV